MLAHFQDEAHKIHEQVQAQEREVRFILFDRSPLLETGTNEIPGARAASAT